MKTLLLIALLSHVYTQAQAQSDFSFTDLQLMDKMSEKQFEMYIQKKGFTLDKQYKDSVLGSWVSYENKSNQSILKQTSLAGSTLGFTTASTDTTTYIKAALLQGYNFVFANEDKTGKSSFYMKNEAVLSVRYFNVLEQREKKIKWLIMVQNTEKKL
jgi:hypothetical protein